VKVSAILNSVMHPGAEGHAARAEGSSRCILDAQPAPAEVSA
jgi:hypothetical protein